MRVLFAFISIFLLSVFLQAESWPTYMHDARRSGNSSVTLKSPVYLQWEYVSEYKPAPAWPPPAKTDYWHREANLKPRVTYDRAYHVVSDGKRLYFGSSANDKVYALDAATGKELWSFFADGPVRLAPTIYKGKIYFGADDGKVYCLDAETGKADWVFQAAEKTRMIPGNERMISVSPIRTSVLIYDDKAYFCAGIFPNEGVTMYELNPADGKVIWKKSDVVVSPQGYILASDDKLFVPTGRTAPQVFDRKNGKRLGAFDGSGGAYALVANDALVFGPGDLGQLDLAEKCDNTIATFNGVQMLVSGNTSYLRSDNEISAINRNKYIDNYGDWEKIAEKRSDLADDVWDLREKRKVALAHHQDVSYIDKRIDDRLKEIEKMDLQQQSIEKGGTNWKLPIKDTYSMILAGNTLIVGGENVITLVNAKNGKILSQTKLEGRVYGLAAADGHLYASTDLGKIYNFTDKKIANPVVVAPQIVENPYGGSSYDDAAQKILDKSGLQKGYCLLLGAGEGELAYALAKKSNLQIIAVESDARKVAKARELLNKAGLYGQRIAFFQMAADKLPFTKNFADLVIIGDSKLTATADQIVDFVKPFGGMAFIGGELIGDSELNSWLSSANAADWKVENDWASYKKGSDPGYGEWTHQYANPGNTASSMDQIKGPMQIQWFGRPGPRKMINRHSRTVAPLFKDGRLFAPADNRVIAVNAYNGTVLWETEVPGSRLLGALKDFSNRVVTDDAIYVGAKDECIGLYVDSGKEKIRIKVPQILIGQPHDWGYIATVDNQLYGTGKKQGATFTILGRFNCDEFEGDFREMILGDYLFSMDRNSGKKIWSYRKGVVFNNTIAIGGDYIYFIESRNLRAVNDADGRLRVDYFCKEETYIVKLDRKTGEKIWEKPFHFPYDQITYLIYSDGVLLSTGSYNVGKNVHYGLFAFDGDSGELLWKNSFKGQEIGGSHGEQWQHPVIIADRIYLFPYDFDLHTGEKGGIVLSKGGCGGWTGSANNLFARKSNPTMFTLDDIKQDGTPLTRVNRPGCWINIIPAGGLISIPESSSGCTCDYPIQTSFVFSPVE